MTIIAQQSQQSIAKARGMPEDTIRLSLQCQQDLTEQQYFYFALRGEYIGPKMNQQFDKITK